MKDSILGINRRLRLSRPGRHHGYAMIDLIVGATLLVALISFVAPLAVRTGRLWQDTDRTRLALDELTNQLETITRLDKAKLETALASLTPSSHIAERLPNVSLEGETLSSTDGTRVVLSLQWDRAGSAQPLKLVGWIDSLPAESEAENATTEENATSEASTDENSQETNP